MARPLRIEFAGALYHVTSWGDARRPIYPQDWDGKGWLEVLGQVCERFNWAVHAYCQMGNQYHLLAETPDGNLAKGMRQLNGVHTQRFKQGSLLDQVLRLPVIFGLLGTLWYGRPHSTLLGVTKKERGKRDQGRGTGGANATP
jgi:REP element-mobilizing transposase RayT